VQNIILALPKGRILKDLQAVFSKINLNIEDEFYNDNTRQLIFKTNIKNLQIIKVRSFDVATFVKFGVADIGICGLDVIEEFASPEIYNLLDLGIGSCRLSLAADKNQKLDLDKISHIRIATKYTNITSKFFAQKSIQAETIKLSGAIEIAPKIGLSDFIVDLVDSGKTLQANNMIEIAKIIEVTSFLIANKTSFMTKNNEINQIINYFIK
jgi:ATP phosphoribosyltransferase